MALSALPRPAPPPLRLSFCARMYGSIVWLRRVTRLTRNSCVDTHHTLSTIPRTVSDTQRDAVTHRTADRSDTVSRRLTRDSRSRASLSPTPSHISAHTPDPRPNAVISILQTVYIHPRLRHYAYMHIHAHAYLLPGVGALCVLVRRSPVVGACAVRVCDSLSMTHRVRPPPTMPSLRVAP